MQDTFCEDEISLMPFSECLLQNTFYKMLAITYVYICLSGQCVYVAGGVLRVEVCCMCLHTHVVCVCVRIPVCLPLMVRT